MFATEHFNEIIQRWTCAAAPIHDPASGRVLGVVDLSARPETVHPGTLSLALATARSVEAQLRADVHERDAMLQARHFDAIARFSATQRALVASDGRVLLSEPHGWAPPVVDIPAGGGELRLSNEVHAVAETLGPDGSFVLHSSKQLGRESCGPGLRLVALGHDRGLVCAGLREMRLLVAKQLGPRRLSGVGVGGGDRRAG